ncbi:NUDIX hydrolase [Leadbetterella byssophila]|uniref:NUDIX hydrolase n=1 Tax=Leadbetterella byssophila TaxID=316068 RepID=UPI0039A3F473
MEKLQDAHKYKLWKSKLEENQLSIKDIEEVHTRRNHKGEVLFSLVLLHATTPSGKKIPPLCLVKGEVVTVLVCLIDQETSEKYLLTVLQRRIAEGGITVEHPAGMVDMLKTPREIALQELREETGLEIEDEQLKPLMSDKRLFPSTGTSDECMYFFYTELFLNKEEIDALDKKQTGVDGEDIQTRVFPFTEAHKRMNNTNCLLLNYLYLQEVEDWPLLKQIKL